MTFIVASESCAEKAEVVMIEMLSYHVFSFILVSWHGP